MDFDSKHFESQMIFPDEGGLINKHTDIYKPKCMLPHVSLEKNGILKVINNHVVVLLKLSSLLQMFKMQQGCKVCVHCFKANKKRGKCAKASMFAKPQFKKFLEELKFLSTGLEQEPTIFGNLSEETMEVLKCVEFLLNFPCSQKKFKSKVASMGKLFKQIYPKSSIKKPSGELISDLTTKLTQWYMNKRAHMYTQLMQPQIPEIELNDFCNRIFTERYLESRIVLIDCRYHYEFLGGHVRNAFNIIDPAVVKTLFFGHEFVNNVDFFDFLLTFSESRIDIQKAEQIIQRFKTELMLGKNESLEKRFQKMNNGKMLVDQKKNMGDKGARFNNFLSMNGKVMKSTGHRSRSKGLTRANLLKEKKESDRFSIMDPKRNSNKNFMEILDSNEQILNNRLKKETEIIFIFYCEFSSERGPKMYNFFRNHDRSVNQYPNLHYPQTYVMKGGFSKFHDNFKYFCNKAGSSERANVAEGEGEFEMGMNGEEFKPDLPQSGTKKIHKKKYNKRRKSVCKVFKTVMAHGKKHKKNKISTVHKKLMNPIVSAKGINNKKKKKPIVINIGKKGNKIPKMKPKVTQIEVTIPKTSAIQLKPKNIKTKMITIPKSGTTSSQQTPKFSVQIVTNKFKKKIKQKHGNKILVNSFNMNLKPKGKTLNVKPVKRKIQNNKQKHKKPKKESKSKKTNDEIFRKNDMMEIPGIETLNKKKVFNQNNKEFTAEAFQKNLLKNSIQSMIGNNVIPPTPESHRYRRMDHPNFKNEYSKEKIQSKLFWKQVQKDSIFSKNTKSVNIK